MDLTTIEREDISGWVRFEDKFDVLIACTKREELAKRIDRCKKTEYVKHQPKETIDEEKLRQELAKCILDWRGLTVGIVATMIPIKVKDEDKDTPVECTEANKMVLLREAYGGFDSFIQNTTTDIALLKQEQERKN